MAAIFRRDDVAYFDPERNIVTLLLLTEALDRES